MKHLILLAGLAATASAEIFQGTLLPQKCRNDEPATHTTECALKCAETGLGMLLKGGDYAPFTPSSQARALMFLKSITRKADLRIQVNGKRAKGGAIEIESIELDEGPRKVAVLLFEGVQIIDFTGPFEILTDAYTRGKPMFEVYTVAAAKQPLRTTGGLSLNPDYAFADAPVPDVLVIPGGSIPEGNETILAWLRQTSPRTEVTLTVCNGVFLLARAGLAKDLALTTTAGNLAKLKAIAPDSRIIADARVTDNGRVITTGGLSAGMDGALHLVARLAGKPTAETVAVFIEYNWQPESAFRPGVLASKHLFNAMFAVVFPMGGELESSNGDRNRWEMRFRMDSQAAPEQVLQQIDQSMQVAAAWTLERPGQWWFRDMDGVKWKGAAEVSAAGGGARRVTLTVSRA